MSLFHLVMPALLIWSLRRTGYHRSGWVADTAHLGVVARDFRYRAAAQHQLVVATIWGPPGLRAASGVFLHDAGYLLVPHPTHLVLQAAATAPP
jgi:hypothetical protein